jgi:putative inorganic carbon (hco3(-)) transporter
MEFGVDFGDFRLHKIKYHDSVGPIVKTGALRRENLALYLTGAAAVSSIVSIAALEILMGMALVAMIVTRQRWRVPPIWLPFSLFVVGTLISVADSGHIRMGWPQVRKFYVYLLLFLVTATFRGVRQIRWLAVGWALAAALSAAWSLEQFGRKYEAAKNAHQDFYGAYVGSRVTGFMSHWMTFSGHMMMALLVIAALVFFSTDRQWSGWLIAAGALVGLGLLAAETRSMWLGTVCGGVYLIWFWRRWLLLALPVLAGIVLLVNPFGLGDRVQSAFHPHGDMDSNAHRAMCRAIGYQMIEAHPWLGVGPEQVGPQHMNYLPPGTVLPLPTGYYGHLHNIYVHYAAERGVPAMLALMWMLGRALFDFVRGLRRLPAGAEERWVLHAAIAVMIGVLVSGYYELNLGDSEVLAMFLAVVGCGYAALAAAKQGSLEANL